jgi:hypothetical protein
MQNIIENNQQKYEDRLCICLLISVSLRGEIEKDFQERIERVNLEKSELENKFIMKKKEIKDNLNAHFKQMQLLEKEKNALNEKFLISEAKRKEILEQNEKEVNSINNNHNNYKKESSVVLSQNQKEIETLKLRIQGLEKDANEKKSIFEKEKMLFESKIKFLENQKELNKKEMIDNQKKFELNLENIQKRSVLEKEKIELAAKNNLSSLDLKYQNQINELNEINSQTCNELQNTIKSLQNELANLNSLCDSKDKWKEEIMFLNQKIQELSNNNDYLIKEIEIQKRDKEIKLTEVYSFMEKEKEVYKEKISDLEKKLSEFESKKGKMIIDFEKEKSKHFSEKDHLESKIRELVDNNDRNEKKIESLNKDIERLKTHKSSQFQQSYYSNNLAGNSMNNVNNNDMSNSHNLSSNYVVSSKVINTMSKSGNNFNTPNINGTPYQKNKDPELYYTVKNKKTTFNMSSSPLLKKDYTRSPANISVDENELENLNDLGKKVLNTQLKSYTIVQYEGENKNEI